MIIWFQTATLEIDGVIPGDDQPTFDAIQAQLSGGQAIFIIADVAAVLAARSDYLVDTYPAPTTTVKKRLVGATISVNPINLNEQPTISVQLYENDDVTPYATGGVVVTFEATQGIFSLPTITTNGSGAGSVSYKPTKFTGVVTLEVSAPLYRPTVILLTIDNPSTAAEQNTIEADDIKAQAISEDKIVGSVINVSKVSQTNPSALWTAAHATLEDVVDTTLDDSVNNIVSDGIDHIYLNGLDAAVPKVKKVNRRTFAIDGSLTYTNDNLSTRMDGVAFDGKNLWVASDGDLLKINPVAMTLTATINIDATGIIQAITWDGELLHLFVKGGTTYVNSYVQVTRNGTVRLAVALSANDVKQIAMRQYTQGLLASASLRKVLVPINFGGNGDIAVMSVNDGGAVVSYFSVISVTATANGVAVCDGVNFWIGVTPSGGSKETLLRLNLDTGIVTTSLLGSLEWGDIGHVYDLSFDGAYVWAITSEAGDPPATTTRRFVRKLQQVGTNPIRVVQTIDLGPDIDPSALCIENDRLFVGNFGATT